VKLMKWPVRWELKTSDFYPIRIDWVEHSNFDGRIGITLCPGKYQPVSWSGGWNRNLETDIKAIAKEGCTTIVSLIDYDEMRILRVENLENMISAYNMNWIHLPIKDTTAPTSEWLDNFKKIEDKLIESLVAGNSIVVHCKGGLDRAGLFACLLLSKTGISMHKSIKMVKNVRNKSCINKEQIEFLHSIKI